MKLVRYAVVTAAFSLAISAEAQTSSLAGRWDVEYQRGLRNENGEVTAVMGKGTLTLAQRGDSLVGEFVPVTDNGSAGRPLAFAAKASSSPTVFVSTSEGRVNMNGEERTVKMTMTWELSASGDALTGTMSRAMEGMDMPVVPSPVRGTRIR